MVLNTLLPAGNHVPTRALFVAREGAYFHVSGGARVDLQTKGPLRRVFRAIVKAHRDRSQRPLSVFEIFEAGWSGEKAAPEALAGRVYSAISKLRAMGLSEVLVRSATGYQLAPRVCVIEEGPLALRREPATVIQREVVLLRMAS